jgi:hypothetical protein
MKTPKGEKRYSSILSLTWAPDGGGWARQRPGRFIPGKEVVPTVYEAGWAPGPVWASGEDLTPTGSTFVDRSAPVLEVTVPSFPHTQIT